MQDLAPGNRQQRRGRGRPRKTPAAPDSLAARRQQQQRASLSIPPSPPIATGAPFSAAEAETTGYDDAPAPADHAPADRAGSPATAAAAVTGAFAGYKGKHGALKTNIVISYGMLGELVKRADEIDGTIIQASAEPIADAWIIYGQADPRVMRVLKLVFGHPAMMVLMAHAAVAQTILAHHGTSPFGLLGGLKLPSMNANGSAAAPAPAGHDVPPPEPAPLPYAPAGAHAPTEAKGPPPAPPSDELRVWPDVDLPADVEVQLRQAARQSGQPYQQLREALLLQIAQQRMAQNGTVYAPGALGMPVMEG